MIQSQLDAEKRNSRFNSVNLLLVNLFIGSMALTAWEIKIYHKTFIPLKIPFLIWVLTGLVCQPILKRTLTVYAETAHILVQMIYCLVTCGGLAVTTFMLANYYLADKETYVENERIISTGTLGSVRGCQQPYIIITHHNQEKQLVYYCGTAVENYQSVDLTLSNGFLGFEIVRNSEFKND